MLALPIGSEVYSSGRFSIEELWNPAVKVGGLMNSHKSCGPCDRFDGKLGLDAENLWRWGSFLICRVVLGMIGDHEEIDGVPARMPSPHPVQRALDYRVRWDTLFQKSACRRPRKIKVEEDDQRIRCVLSDRIVEEVPYI